MVTKKKIAKKKTTKKKTAGKSSMGSSAKVLSSGSEISMEKPGSETVKYKLEKNLTVSNAQNLKQELLALLVNANRIELDGAEVEMIDSAGLQVLTSFFLYVKNKSIDIEWTGISEAIKTTADIIGISRFLDL